MLYTIKSGRFANATGTAIEALTEEVGSRAFSAADTPEEWAVIMAQIQDGTLIISPYVVQAASITVLQFALGLWKRGEIILQDAQAFAGGGTIPPLLQALIDELPQNIRGEVMIRAAGATDFPIDHPFVKMLAEKNGWSQEDIAEFWAFCRRQ